MAQKWHSYATVPRHSDGPMKKLCGSSTKGASRSLNKLDDRSEVRPWHRYARFKPETERLVGRRMALVEAARGKVSCSLNQPDDMGFPACHIGQKKFYWASVLSTIFREKPFGQQVERLSPFWDQTYAVERFLHNNQTRAGCLSNGSRRSTRTRSLSARPRAKWRAGRLAGPAALALATTTRQTGKTHPAGGLHDSRLQRSW